MPSMPSARARAGPDDAAARRRRRRLGTDGPRRDARRAAATAARRDRRVSVLSDRDIRAALEAGRIRIDPYDPACLQPSSVDLHLDRDSACSATTATRISTRAAPARPDRGRGVNEDEPFILHPGRVRARPDARVGRAPGRCRRQARRQELVGAAGAAHPFDGGVRRPGLEGQPHARALERRPRRGPRLAGRLPDLSRRRGGRYKIFHDVLAGAVLGWSSRYAAERAIEAERHRRRARSGSLQSQWQLRLFSPRSRCSRSCSERPMPGTGCAGSSTGRVIGCNLAYRSRARASARLESARSRRAPPRRMPFGTRCWPRHCAGCSVSASQSAAWTSIRPARSQSQSATKEK